jgi:hypothetical protein
MEDNTLSKNDTSSIIKIVDCVKKPKKALYINKAQDKIFVSHENGCSIIDIKENREIQKISKFSCNCLAADVKTEQVAFSRDKTIVIYNTKTAQYEWRQKTKKTIRSFYFVPFDKTIFFHLGVLDEGYGVVKRYNYVTNKCSEDYISFKQYYKSFVFHPTKQIICWVEGHTAFLYNSFDFNIKLQSINLPCTSSYYQISSKNFLAVANALRDEIIVIDIHKSNDNWLSIKRRNERFLKMLFCSEGRVLVTISRLIKKKQKKEGDNNKRMVCFWDLKAEKGIFQPLILYNGTLYDFTFSPDEKEMLFVFDEGCIIHHVPFEVLYESEIQKKFSFLVFVLKSIAQQNQSMPQEIIKFLIHICFELFRRR